MPEKEKIEKFEKYLEKIGLGPRGFSVAEEKEVSEIKLREAFVYALIVVFSVSVISTFVLVFLNGLGVTDLSDGILYSLIGASVAEIVGILIVPTKYLFPK